ncbi:MAG TPA: hypothetical protein VMM15_06430 [Bradyrhizobium sp.]|nr:hypothetical protein [Bradyrhizobium sp.]
MEPGLIIFETEKLAHRCFRDDPDGAALADEETVAAPTKDRMIP